MVAESPNLYIANLLKEQQESKDFVRCICLDNNQKRGWAELLQKNWKTILYLLDEAQFVDADTPPKLDLRMEELAKKKPDHPAVKAYQRYRGGPDETIRSVIMTVNARMQPFDNEELLEIFSSNDIPLDEFGVGIDGDKKTKSNLFIIIPDDDDTFNFVPAWFTRCFFRSYTVRRGSLAESCRWMSVSGWMKWQISRCRTTLIRFLQPAVAEVCTAYRFYSPWHS